MAKYQLTYGIQQKPLKLFAYGPEGIGKSTFAAQMPDPVFIDVEDGSNQLPVARLPQPTSWAMLMDELNEVCKGDVPCASVVIDTVDAAQNLAIRDACIQLNIKSVEEANYGKGYVRTYELWCKMLDLLDLIRTTRGINVILLGHSRIDRMERPDADGSYDHFVPNLNNGRRSDVAGVTKQWSDVVLFFDYKTIVETESDRKGNVKKAKAKGGRRIIHATHHPCWDAKNRFGWPDEMPLNDQSIQEIRSHMTTIDGATMQMQQPSAPIPHTSQLAQLMQPQPAPQPPQASIDDTLARMDAELQNAGFTAQPMQPEQPTLDPRDSYPPHAQALADLMRANDVTDEELRKAVVSQNYPNCPVEQYPQDFVAFLTANFTEQILPVIDSQRVPF